ncbi:MAG: heme exporter protein CcmB [Dehalococcoidia bacterium]|nr:heme exporter protein CcmB [Dehalococcoidia bacterium]
MSFWRQALAVAHKDVVAELRSREIITSVLVFAVLVLVIFNFAFTADVATMTLIAPGVLWVAFAFAGVLALNRTFIPEKEEGCLEGLLACPAEREAIYLGKMLGTLFFLLLVEAVVLPIFALLFNINVFQIEILAVTALGTIGFTAIGTVFAALAVNTRAREMVLPILFLPIVSPVIIAVVESSALALDGGGFSDMAVWLIILISFDVIFLTVPFLVFSYVIEE